MKLEKITHDHLLTKWLKVIIFSLLMLAPIFSIAVRCAYVVCNKNAYQSYYGETINEQDTTLLTNITQFETYKTYNFNMGTFQLKDTVVPQGAYANRIYVSNVRNVVTTYENLDLSNIDAFALYIDAGMVLRFRPYINNESGNIYGTDTGIISFDFDYVSDNLLYNFAYNDVLSKVTFNNYSYLDNVFDYSVAQLKQDQLFNWTQNTGVYTGVNAMTTGLGMTDGTIAILLTYWMLLTIIYVIIDIVLAGFTMLTHMIYNKKVD